MSPNPQCTACFLPFLTSPWFLIFLELWYFFLFALYLSRFPRLFLISIISPIFLFIGGSSSPVDQLLHALSWTNLASFIYPTVVPATFGLSLTYDVLLDYCLAFFMRMGSKVVCADTREVVKSHSLG